MLLHINVSAQVSLLPEDANLSINQSESKIQLQARLSEPLLYTKTLKEILPPGSELNREFDQLVPESTVG